MTVLDELNFDGLAEGPVVLAGPWQLASGGVTPTVAQLAAIHGARGCRWSSTGSYGRIDYYFDSAFTAARVLSFYFNSQTFSSANQYIAAVGNGTDAAGVLQGDWRVNTSRTVSIRNGSTAVATSSATLSAATDYRAEWKIDPAANTQELRIYTGESTTALLTLTGAWSSDTAASFSFGPILPAAGGAIDYDTVKIADDWTGPEVAPVTLTPVLRRFRYNGSAWE